MKSADFELLDWLNSHHEVKYNLGSSALSPLKLTELPGFNPQEFDFLLDCGTDGGDALLKQMIAERYSVDTHQVAITTGASEGNFLVEALHSPGKIAVETPTYPPLYKLTEVLGSKLIRIPRRYEKGFQFDAEELKERAGDADLFVFTNLHNPSGTALPLPHLREVVEICEDVGTMVLVDEIFLPFSEVSSAVNCGENVIVGSSPSKFFGGCGLRVGHLVGPAWLIREIEKLKLLLVPNESVLSQRAYRIIMQEMDWFIRHGRKVMSPAKEIMAQWVNERDDVEWVPPEGNICFPLILHPETGISASTMDLGKFLAERHGVLITPGEYFGQAGHIRIGFGKPVEQLKSALTALAIGLDEWWRKT